MTRNPRPRPRPLAAGVILLLGCMHHAGAGDLASGVTLYENCDDLRPAVEGEKITGSVRLREGKFGRSLLIERRTLNHVANGDFRKAFDDSWVYGEKGGWQKTGGMNDSSCLMIGADDAVALPLLYLKPGRAHAFSVYARPSKPDVKTTLTITWSCAGQVRTLLSTVLKAKRFQRVKRVFFPRKDSGTLRIRVNSPVLIDNAQLDPGVTFFNTFARPLKQRGCDWISLAQPGRFFDAKQGAMSCWLKVPWLTDKIFSDDGFILYKVSRPSTGSGKWGDRTVFAVGCWARRQPDNPKDKGRFGVTAIDSRGQVAGLSALLEEIPGKPRAWRHLVINWHLADNRMQLEMYLDGGEFHVARTLPFGEPRIPKTITIGYGGGGYLNGLLDDFVLFRRPLTKAEVKMIYGARKALGELLQLPGGQESK